MTKHILFPIALVALIIAILGYLINALDTGKIKIENINEPKSYILINNIKINIEISDTEEKRQKGLSFRTNLEKNSGMLFVFDSLDVSPMFWMKDMRIPLDIIWINDNYIVKIDENIPPPKNDEADDTLTRYFSSSATDYVLEVNANFTKENSIKVGDVVDLKNSGI